MFNYERVAWMKILAIMAHSHYKQVYFLTFLSLFNLDLLIIS
uniref:Uncharacterized protein n=1 Tax=Solanum lycopersicum TaxID=4081 RepID=A0A3Q7FLR6_SOLLC